MQAPCNEISIRNELSLPNFPQRLNSNETEAFTCSTWNELFDQAVAHHCPQYAIAIAPLPQKSPEEMARYKIYDARAFRNYQHAQQTKGELLLDLETREQIPAKKVQYMAVKCFDLDRNGVKPVPLSGQEFTSLYPRFLSAVQRVKSILQESRRSSRIGLDGEEIKHRQTFASAMRANYLNQESLERVVGSALKIIHDYSLDGLNLHIDVEDPAKREELKILSQSQSLVADAYGSLLDGTQQAIWSWCSRQNLRAREERAHAKVEIKSI